MESLSLLFQVTYKADSLYLDFLKLAQNGNPLLSIIGEFEWQCRDIGPGMPLPYTSDGDTNLVIHLFYTKIPLEFSVFSLSYFYLYFHSYINLDYARYILPLHKFCIWKQYY